MSREAIVERIISDAKAEAEGIETAANQKAAEILFQAEEKARIEREKVEQDMAVKKESILSKKAAAARLESAKILLAEKRAVIDEIYQKALDRLLALNQEDTLKITQNLLEKYAENGDELFFAENYPYKDSVKLLPVVTKKGLKISNSTVTLSGGFVLKGVYSDKDLSYAAILAADREEFQSAIAAEIFD